MAKLEKLRAEFAEKNSFLASVGRQLSPAEFYDFVYFDLADDEPIMAVEAKKKYFAVAKEDIIDVVQGRDDIYLAPVQFWQNYKRDDFIDKIWAFVVDIDNVAPGALAALFRSVQRGNGPMPTIIINSGSGIHFYYLLKKPYLTHIETRKNARELYTELNRVFEFRTDKHSIGHAYRAVGSLTKLGDVASAFLVGTRWSIEELADEVGYVWIEPFPAANEKTAATDKMRVYAQALAKRAGVPEPDYNNFNATHDFIKSQRKTRFIKSGLDPRDLKNSDIYTTAAPNAGKNWYYDVRTKVMLRTELYHRYTSLMALSVIAYKCRIPKEELLSDLENIADEWEFRKEWANDPFNRKNLPDAARCYSQRFVKVTRAQLEEWLGWEFQRRDPPKHTQKDHLASVADKKRGNSLGRVLEAVKANPDATITEISRATGLCRNTVYKYHAAACAIIGKK